MSNATPFFGGRPSADRRPPQSVALDGQWYPVLDVDQYQHRGLDRIRQGQSLSDEPSDRLLNPEGSWWRYRFDWHLGAGQFLDELNEQSSPFRFRSSNTMNPWTRDELRIAANIQPIASQVSSFSNQRLAATDTTLFWSFNNTLRRSTDGTTWSDVTGLSGIVRELIVVGDELYVYAGNEIYRVGAGSTSATLVHDVAPPWGIVPISGFAHVSGRILVAVGASLYEAKFGATPSTGSWLLVYASITVNFRWSTIFTVGSRVYAGGHAGKQSELYTFLTDGNGDLVRSNEATTFSQGEQLLSVAVSAGLIVFGTNLGVRLATLAGDANITYGPLISEVGECRAITIEGEYAWCSSPQLPDNNQQLYRLHLADFVDSLLPAYATDARTLGPTTANRAIVGVVRFGAATYVCIDALGVYESLDASTCLDGDLTSEAITMGTVELKQFSELEVQHRPLRAGDRIDVTILDRNGQTLLTASNEATDSTEHVVDLTSVRAQRITIKLGIHSSSFVESPVITQWRLRGFPIAPGVEEWIVPLVLHDQLVVGNGAGFQTSVDVDYELARIIDMWSSGRTVLYQEGSRSTAVRVDNFGIQRAKWNADGTDLEVTCIVRLLSVR